ncbi:MAG: hypothetical protein AAGH53_01750 [Pseudomonadota bacterium]
MDDPLHLTPWQRLALAYVPVSVRKAQETVLAMDAIGGKICDSTSEMLLGQMRYAWWRDVMNGTSTDRRTGHPLLELIGEQPGFEQQALVPIIDAWESYIVDADGAYGGEHARDRGAALAQCFVRLGMADDSKELDNMLGCYALWDDIRMGRYDGEAAITVKQVLGKQLNPLRNWKIPRRLRILAIIREMIVRDALHDGWDKPLMRPSMAARIIRRGLTG